MLALCVIATGAIWLFRTGGGKSQQHASHLAISPDGGTLAFVWDQGNGASPQIATLATGESSPRPLMKATGRSSSPAWSPDGKSLAYVRVNNEQGEMVMAHRDGSDERTLPGMFPMAAELPYRVLDWSPDGQTIAVGHAASNGEPIGIFLVSPATGDTKQLTSSNSGDHRRCRTAILAGREIDRLRSGVRRRQAGDLRSRYRCRHHAPDHVGQQTGEWVRLGTTCELSAVCVEPNGRVLSVDAFSAL